MEVNEEEINQILGAMFTNSIDIGNFFQIYISKILGGIPHIGSGPETIFYKKI